LELIVVVVLVIDKKEKMNRTDMIENLLSRKQQGLLIERKATSAHTAQHSAERQGKQTIIVMCNGTSKNIFSLRERMLIEVEKREKKKNDLACIYQLLSDG
jgi:hypothetical protein